MPYQYTPSDIQRFNSKIKIMPSGCHEWQASLKKSGYGQFKVNGKMRIAHRIAWEIASGPIPDGMMCLHRCDNPRCTNVEHLWLGTQRENVLDCVAKGRSRVCLGEKSGKSKLTTDDVIRIREMFSGGNYSYKQISSMFPVCPNAIRKIVLRERWGHVT